MMAAASGVLQADPLLRAVRVWAPPVIDAVLFAAWRHGPGARRDGVGWMVVMNVVQPRLMAGTVGFTARGARFRDRGGKLAGIAGAIFGIPVAAVIVELLLLLPQPGDGGPAFVAVRAARRSPGARDTSRASPVPPTLTDSLTEITRAPTWRSWPTTASRTTTGRRLPGRARDPRRREASQGATCRGRRRGPVNVAWSRPVPVADHAVPAGLTLIVWPARSSCSGMPAGRRRTLTDLLPVAGHAARLLPRRRSLPRGSAGRPSGRPVVRVMIMRRTVAPRERTRLRPLSGRTARPVPRHLAGDRVEDTVVVVAAACRRSRR